jgi:hypothetical protein
MTDSTPINVEGTVIEQGAEIHFTGDRDAFPADYVRILPSGYVMAISRVNYSVTYFPPHRIDGVHTHTTDVQEAEILGVNDD